MARKSLVVFTDLDGGVAPQSPRSSPKLLKILGALPPNSPLAAASSPNGTMTATKKDSPTGLTLQEIPADEAAAIDAAVRKKVDARDFTKRNE